MKLASAGRRRDNRDGFCGWSDQSKWLNPGWCARGYQGAWDLSDWLTSFAAGWASDQLPLQGSFTPCGPVRAVGPGRVLDTPTETFTQ
jgi:hypothetical protein